MSDDNFLPINLIIGEGDIRVKAENVKISGGRDSITLHFHGTLDAVTSLGQVSLNGGAWGSLAKFLAGGEEQPFARYMPKDPHTLPKCPGCGGRTFDTGVSARCRAQKGLISFYCHTLSPGAIDQFEERWAKVEADRRRKRSSTQHKRCEACETGAPGPCKDFPACSQVVEPKRGFREPLMYGNDLGPSDRMPGR